MFRTTPRFLVVVTSLIYLLIASRASADSEMWEKTVHSTVWITTDVGSGSGVVVQTPDGAKVVATNFHVVANADEIVCFFPVFENDALGLPNGNRLPLLTPTIGV